MKRGIYRWGMLAAAIGIALAAAPGQRLDAQAKGASVSANPVTDRRDELLGEWWTEGHEGRIRFTRDRDGTYRGTTSCCIPAKAKPEDLKDIHNPKPEQRSRPTMGLTIIWKLNYDDGEYTGGYVYNPRDGKTYRFKVKVIDRETVQIRGYMGIPLLGQSQVWKRYHEVAPATASAR